MIHRPPKIVHLAVNFHEHFVQVPLPVLICPHRADPFLTDLRSKYWTKSVPPKSNRLMADVDAALVKRSSTFRSESGNSTYWTCHALVPPQVLV
ncbi:hypothetical protein GGR95_003616 [Sulfitobacter undariae]|uniref:Uncharacterized protein n=1 Tax=Sulfitobacter undariae TaxID=1563671 RepID=A0A7W6E736_9RHOB|nr:hypothetical protein [Sulfitobacter undariae]